MDNLNYDERSTGGIVYRLQNSRPLWLVIKVLSKKSSSKNTTHRTIYKFPKGHLQGGEVLKQAALREVEEEGQVKSRIVDKIGSNDYVIWDKALNKNIVKKVTFYLMEYLEDSLIKYSDCEVILNREWLTAEEAIKKLGYSSEKTLLKKAIFKLDSLLKSEKR
jgi:8-oxo-dGTP diphosphatase